MDHFLKQALTQEKGSDRLILIRTILTHSLTAKDIILNAIIKNGKATKTDDAIRIAKQIIDRYIQTGNTNLNFEDELINAYDQENETVDLEEALADLVARILAPTMQDKEIQPGLSDDKIKILESGIDINHRELKEEAAKLVTEITAAFPEYFANERELLNLAEARAEKINQEEKFFGEVAKEYNRRRPTIH